MLAVVEVKKPSSSGERASASGENLEMKTVRKTTISYRNRLMDIKSRPALLADTAS